MKQYDIVIIGAGIAGLTAAIYARRAGKSVIILESRVEGGQIINTFQIENWPGDMGVSGVDLMRKVAKQAEELGAEIEYEEVLGVSKTTEETFLVKTDSFEYIAGAVIIAVGSNERKMDVPGEEKFTGRGVSYCATCDGAFYKGGTVAVVGGGNTAFYDALYLADLAKKVYLVHRRNEFRADKMLVDKLKSRNNVEFLTPFVPKEVLGDKKASGLSIVSRDDGMVEKTLDIDGIFVAVGRIPATAVFSGLVDLDESGYIVAGEDCHTSCPGVFVAGDVRTKEVRQLVTAAADGAVAATEAVRFL